MADIAVSHTYVDVGYMSTGVVLGGCQPGEGMMLRRRKERSGLSLLSFPVALKTSRFGGEESVAVPTPL